jgi:hypothetical protein
MYILNWQQVCSVGKFGVLLPNKRRHVTQERCASLQSITLYVPWRDPTRQRPLMLLLLLGKSRLSLGKHSACMLLLFFIPGSL